MQRTVSCELFFCFIIVFSMAMCTPSAFAQKPSAWNDMISVAWDGTLRNSLEQITKSRNITLFVDRRVDPGMPLQFNASQRSVHDVFEQVAEHCKLGFYRLGNIAYFGPPESAELLPLLVELCEKQSEKQPAKVKKSLQSPINWRVEPLEAPSEMLQRLATQLGFNGTAFQQLPYDAWLPLDFANESPSVLLPLFLIGFDQMYVVSKNGEKLASMPIPKETLITRNYSDETMITLLKNDLAILAPTAVMSETKQGASVKLSLQDAAKIEAIARDRNRKQQASKQTTNAQMPTVPNPNETMAFEDADVRLKNERFTLQVVNKPLESLLKQFADRLQLTLTIDRQSFADQKIKLDTLVTSELEKATYRELFEKCVEPVGAKCAITGNEIIVSAR